MYVRNAASYLTITKKLRQVQNVGKKYEEKFQGTIIGKWIKYWKTLYTDYKDVAIDIRKGAQERPLKAAGIVTTFAFLWLCAKKNPDETNYRDAVLSSINEVIQVNPSMQRKECAEYLRLVEKCYNANVLRRLNFGILSVMWVDNYSNLCNTYECTCSYLELPYSRIFHRIIDIGFFNKWWLLQKHMEDFDVNY